MTTEDMNSKGIPASDKAPIEQVPVSEVADDHAVRSLIEAEKAKTAKIDALLRAWVQDHLHGSAVSRYTEAFNHVTASLPALRELIMKEF